jgi:hypothetical protein
MKSRSLVSGLSSLSAASVSRRSALRGLGVSVALPALVSLGRGQAFAAPTASRLATTETGVPLRMAFMSIPNGVQQNHWFPTGDPKEFNLNTTMEPLAGLKSHFQVIAGLGHENATAGRDGAGDHARANATFLTGARARKTSGRDIFVGASVDQVAAQAAAEITRFQSLELTCDSVRNSGSCDSGYACAYQFNISWSSPTTPVTPDSNPRAVFERLFGEGPKDIRSKNYAKREATQRSVLDFVMEDAANVQKELSADDQRKLDEYLAGVRDIEKRIASSSRFGETPNPDLDTPVGIPLSFADHIDLMFDMLTLAFQTDATRVGTLLLANDGSNRIFPDIGVPEGHHHLSHNQSKEDLAAKVALIDRFYATRMARFLEKLSNIQDVDGNSLLHNSMIVYGGAIADGNRHSHHNLPVILAGHAGGRIQTGRYLQVKDQPMSNLFVSMLNHYGVETDQFGDSTGRLEEL